MANKEHLHILREGIVAWRQWRTEKDETPDLSGANLSSMDLHDADLHDADLSGTDLYGADLQGADIQGANLHRADLRETDFRGADFRNANISDADLTEANLGHTDFRGAFLTRANFRPINVDEADLTDADLSEAYLRKADLRGAVLHKVDLSGAFLYRAILSGVDLRDADFSGADLTLAELDGADLSGANFSNAELIGTNLCQTDLSYADLSDADLSHADLDGVNFQNATTESTIFADCDLSAVLGLDFIRHRGPSSIGIDTIYKSQGKIPHIFLRECGVPESFITQMSALVAAEDGIQFYSCFISYSSKDEEFARRVHGRMRDARMRVWFAPEDIQAGKKLHDQIETAIRVYDKLLIVLSESSMQSEWVMDELRKGFKAESDGGKRKLFPVRLTDYETLQRWVCRDSISGKDLAEEVRQYFIPNFSNWKDHDQFEAAFARLLNDLRADERAE